MPETHQLQLTLDRSALPAELDVDDPAAPRAALLQVLADTFALAGKLPPAVRLLGPGAQEVCDLSRAVDVDNDALIASVFRALDRPGMTRRFRQGEVLLELKGGERRRAIALLEWRDEDRWWVAWRLVGTGEGEVGVFHSAWSELEGQGLEALGEPFDAWADPGRARVETVATSELKPRTDFDIGCFLRTLPVDPPRSAEALAQWIGDSFDQELAARGLPKLTFFTFSGRNMERWEVTGQPPCSLDDLLRAAAARVGAEALCLVHPCTVQLDDRTVRGWTYAVDTGGHRFDRTLVLQRADGAVRGAVSTTDRGATSAWIGVAPTVEVKLDAMAPSGEIPES